MNVFWLHENTSKCAKMHCDRHIERCVYDYARIVSTAADMGGFYDRRYMYEPLETMGLDIARWAAHTTDNFCRILSLAKDVGKEYEHRFGTEHKSHIQCLSNIDVSEVEIHRSGFETPPVKIPDGFTTADGYIQQYRDYYNHGMTWNMSWFNRETPDWYYKEEAEYGVSDE